MLELAYPTTQVKIGTLAYSSGLDPQWVRKLTLFVAATYLRYQNLLIGMVVNKALQKAPLAAMWRLKWDDTGQNVTMQANPEALFFLQVKDN